jgi:seryl-tRNA synthetase
MPMPDVIPGGKESNRVIKTVGKAPKFDFTPLDHVELCTKLGLIDYERAARMSGAKTWVYTGLGARLEWALLNYMIDFHIKNGYTLIMPPHILNYDSGYSAGQFPKFVDDVFCTDTEDNRRIDPASTKFRFLLPTSETALINMHRGEIIPSENLPIKYAAYSPCYRREAGGYRATERGMVRGHQFNKIEMFAFCKPEDSLPIFFEFVSNAEKLVEELGLHFQTVALAAGDVSASMRKTYDIEVYIPSMNEYKEVSSASMAGDYQARRAQIRTRVESTECDGMGCKIKAANQYVHTLNASGLATSRLFPAIIEQFQTKDGHVVIPHALRPYMGGLKII